ncbi:DNA repair protein rhp55 [Zalerion maritima]|uniref:DNA repair protein rhp55 n=1 Tax=Zalerion maritima TaxID=339359 RepID=A0AAD5WNW9_9PEZI|nr:DNA repair protein rhp55 [Zalerion maritima]
MRETFPGPLSPASALGAANFGGHGQGTARAWPVKHRLHAPGGRGTTGDDGRKSPDFWSSVATKGVAVGFNLGSYGHNPGTNPTECNLDVKQLPIDRKDFPWPSAVHSTNKRFRSIFASSHLASSSSASEAGGLASLQLGFPTGTPPTYSRLCTGIDSTMDKYYEIHGHDVSSFDVSTTHRLPTVSAADALEDFEQYEVTGFIPTGLPSLDRLLANVDLDDSESHLSGGLLKGQLTEIWGPPGSGKTALGIQLAVNAIEAGGRVTWVDALYPVCQSRLDAVHQFAVKFQDDSESTARHGEGNSSLPNDSTTSYRSKLDHFSCPSLAHIVALLCRSTPRCLAPDTSLLVIDSLSALVNYAYPRAPETRRAGQKTQGAGGLGQSSRRLQALQYIIEALQKLAATRNTAILILSQCATKMQAEARATLIPSINATSWDQGVSTRIAIFRDWIWRGKDPTTVRLLGIQKLNGKPSTAENVVAFSIDTGGLSEVLFDASQPPVKVSTPRRKRKLSDTGFEIPDSEDEEYGWNEDEEEIALPSTLEPQWHGSEDVLLHPYQDEETETSGGPLQEGELLRVDASSSISPLSSRSSPSLTDQIPR